MQWPLRLRIIHRLYFQLIYAVPCSKRRPLRLHVIIALFPAALRKVICVLKVYQCPLGQRWVFRVQVPLLAVLTVGALPRLQAYHSAGLAFTCFGDT